MSTNADPIEIYTYKQVAEILHISLPQVYRLAKRKINPLPVFYMSESTPRIRKQDLAKWLESQIDPRRDI